MAFEVAPTEKAFLLALLIRNYSDLEGSWDLFIFLPVENSFLNY